MKPETRRRKPSSTGAASNYDDEELMEGNKLRCKGDFEKIQRMTAFAGSSKETG